MTTPAEKAQKALTERNAQLAGYRRHKARERDELCNGQYGEHIKAVVAFLKTMTIEDANTLVVKVARAQWLLDSDIDTRHKVLSMIDDAIIKLRIRNGLSPFDDEIGDGTLTAFQLIRLKMLGV